MRIFKEKYEVRRKNKINLKNRLLEIMKDRPNNF